jgi:hypothetical protein
VVDTATDRDTQIHRYTDCRLQGLQIDADKELIIHQVRHQHINIRDAAAPLVRPIAAGARAATTTMRKRSHGFK